MLEPNFITEQVDSSPSYGKFILSPLPAGFGHTLGNALRRAILCSIPGVAVTYIKINDITHPFSTIKGVKESVVDIILNIKLLRFKASGKGPFQMDLVVKGKKKILGRLFKAGDIEVVNKDHYITEIVDNQAKLEITLFADRGYGYSPSEEKEKKEFGVLALDSIFSPVTKVNYFVEKTRVGRKTNFDKLILEISTDETISPATVLKEGTTVLGKHFNYILSGKDVKKTSKESSDSQTELSKKVDSKVYQTIIDELDLPTRVINAFLREKIETIEDLVSLGKENIVNLKGVGKKSIDLVQKELEKLNIPFD
jgi:DNA-directed RNA polymerase subunit alpha